LTRRKWRPRAASAFTSSSPQKVAACRNAWSMRAEGSVLGFARRGSSSPADTLYREPWLRIAASSSAPRRSSQSTGSCAGRCVVEEGVELVVVAVEARRRLERGQRAVALARKAPRRARRDLVRRARREREPAAARAAQMGAHPPCDRVALRGSEGEGGEGAVCQWALRQMAGNAMGLGSGERTRGAPPRARRRTARRRGCLAT
jgi:hypothetical protein